MRMLSFQFLQAVLVCLAGPVSALYGGGGNSGEPSPELSETLAQYTTLNFVTSTPAFPPRPSNLPLQSNTKDSMGK